MQDETLKNDRCFAHLIPMR